MSTSIDDLRQRLARFISQQTGSAARITMLQRLSGGASRDTWALDLEIDTGRDAGTYALILRRDAGSSMNPEALSREQEFRLLRAAYAYGVAVPRVRWLCTDTAVLGAPFLLMDRIAGESLGTRIVRRPEFAAARARLPQHMVEQLARIHALPTDHDGVVDLPRPAAGQSPAQHALAGVARTVAALDLHNPAVAWALRWLEHHAPPPPATLTVVHGDFRIGNMIVAEDGLRAVIDWEFAHLGDPHEDLAWPCVRDWRFGADQLEFGGVGRRDDVLAAYARAAGREVDRAAVHWWEILGNLRWSVTCVVQAERHLSGRDWSIELASLGRRAAEMELEYLRLIAATH